MTNGNTIYKEVSKEYKFMHSLLWLLVQKQLTKTHLVKLKEIIWIIFYYKEIILSCKLKEIYTSIFIHTNKIIKTKQLFHNHILLLPISSFLLLKYSVIFSWGNSEICFNFLTEINIVPKTSVKAYNGNPIEIPTNGKAHYCTN